MLKLLTLAIATAVATSAANAEIIHVHFLLDGSATHAVFPMNDDDLLPDDPSSAFHIEGNFEIDTTRIYTEHVFVDDRPGYVQLLDSADFSGSISGHTVNFLGIQIAYDPRQFLGEGLTFCGWSDSRSTQLCGAGGASNAGTFSWAQNLSGAGFIVAPDVKGWMSGFYTGNAPGDGTFLFTMSRPFVFDGGSNVPEPAVWVNLLVGFALVGGSWRFQSRRKISV